MKRAIYISAIKEFSSIVGYDIDAIIPLVSPSFGPTFTCNDGPIVSLASECVLRKKVEKFHSINSMELSRLSPKLERHRMPMSFESAQRIFGDSVVVSRNLSRSTVIRFDEAIENFNLNLVSTLLNDSVLMPVKFFIDDKLAAFYFKKNSTQIVDDLTKLKFNQTSPTLAPGLNITVGRSSTNNIRLNTKFSSVTILYGGDFDEETKKILRTATSYAENLFLNNVIAGSSSLNLTDVEMDELKMKGKLAGFESRYVKDPLKYSTFLATDPNNLRFFRRT